MATDTARATEKRPTNARPWLCPEPRCTPLINLRDGDHEDISVPAPGQSFTCWGRMAEPVTFIYDGVEHPNDCNSCHYTPLKGLIRWQENPGDWAALASYYRLANRKATGDNVRFEDLLRASADAANRLLREVLEAVCGQQGISLDSVSEPGSPASNYELADRLGIGHVFGMTMDGGESVA